jgi:hypothetical protein
MVWAGETTEAIVGAMAVLVKVRRLHRASRERVVRTEQLRGYVWAHERRLVTQPFDEFTGSSYQ